MNINLKEITKEELLRLWREANMEKRKPTESINEYCNWLTTHDFGSDVMNYLALEIKSCINYICVHGLEWYNVKTEEEEYYEVDKNNPDIKRIVELSVKNVMDDTDLLKSYGITRGKVTKKYPYQFLDINWNSFNLFLTNN